MDFLKQIPAWVWALIIGGIITYIVHKTKKAYTWIAGIITAVAAGYLFLKR